MTTASSLVAVTILVVLVGGCARTGAPVGRAANVAGSWSGGTVGAAGTSVALVLRQQGEVVTGTINVGGRTDLSGGLSGSVSGNTLSFKLDHGGATIQLTVSQNTMTGVVGSAGAASFYRN